ncbi:MAG: HD domain-containing protein [Candidatus Diapherotrites archaeon]|nr:HD domain-containing protein [Candidatus Diapherotrites archaeon]
MGFREEIEEYSESKTGKCLPAGFDHFKRVYALAKKLADGYDDDVLHAAALLHDIELAGEEHEKDSASAAEAFLKTISFPADKVYAVMDCILNHIPEGNPKSLEAKMIHDADLLDFMGATGVARLSGMTAEDWFEKTSLGGVAEVWEESQSYTTNLFLDRSKELARDKVAFTENALTQLRREMRMGD